MPVDTDAQNHAPEAATTTSGEHGGEKHKTIQVGMVGSGYVAKAHTLAYNNAPLLYWPNLPQVNKRRIADVSPELAARGAQRLGWSEGVDDWRRVTQADDIDLVDIVTPNDTHAEIAIDAANHGKHVLCEKPLALDATSAAEMARAAHAAGVVNQVCFTYRSWPGVRLARKLIDEGRLGRIVHFRAFFLQDYALDATLPLVWRMQREKAGSGKLGDGGSHLIDLARYLVGDVDRVFARLNTVIKERPAAIDRGEAVFRAKDAATTGELIPVDVEDTADLLLDFAGGATGLVQTSWVASGHKLDLGFEIGGEHGAIRISWQRANEIEVFFEEDDAETPGFRTILLGPAHPGGAEFWSVPGQQLGMNDAFLMMIRETLSAVSEKRAATPDFVDGLRACEVVDAALASGRSERWVDVERTAIGGPS
jgi:predicted dehydrogenase